MPVNSASKSWNPTEASDGTVRLTSTIPKESVVPIVETGGPFRVTVTGTPTTVSRNDDAGNSLSVIFYGVYMALATFLWFAFISYVFNLVPYLEREVFLFSKPLNSVSVFFVCLFQNLLLHHIL